MPYPAKAPTRAMLTTFSPSADSPPSANTSAWTTSTTATASAPANGPTSTAASTPPKKWPLVPLATGKLIIWAAKTNAAASPTTGMSRSSSVRDVLRRHHATPPIATTRREPTTSVRR